MWISLARRRRNRTRRRREQGAENAPKAHRAIKERAHPRAPIFTGRREIGEDKPRTRLAHLEKKKNLKPIFTTTGKSDTEQKTLNKRDKSFLAKMVGLTKEKARKATQNNFKDPFKKVNFIINKEKICKERKERRQEIMKKTKGKGASIKNAIHNPLSKLVRCK